MNCTDVRAELVDLLYGELEEHERTGASAHLERCADCRPAWVELRSVAAALDRWVVPAPRGIADRVLARLAIREAAAARAHGAGPALPHLLGFLLAGAAAAGVSVLLIAGAPVPHEGLSIPKVGLAAAVWAALYGGAGFLTQHGRYRRLAAAAAVAAGLSVLAAPVLSMPAVIEACRRWLEAAEGSVVLNGLIVLAGALYAAAPVWFSGAIVARPHPGGIMPDALRLAGVYGVLLAPSVYLQCHAVALSLVAPWVGGVLLGALLGSAGGVAVASRLHPAPA